MMTTITLIGVPNTWPFPVLALRLEYENMALPLVDHLYSMGHPPFQLLFSFGGWPPLHLCDLISVPLQKVDGSRVTSLATLHI